MDSRLAGELVDWTPDKERSHLNAYKLHADELTRLEKQAQKRWVGPQTQVKALDLEQVLIDILKKAGIHTLGLLVSKTQSELRQLNINDDSLEQLTDALAELGLTLRE